MIKCRHMYLSVAPVLCDRRIDLWRRGRGHAGYGHTSCTARAGCRGRPTAAATAAAVGAGPRRLLRRAITHHRQPDEQQGRYVTYSILPILTTLYNTKLHASASVLDPDSRLKKHLRRRVSLLLGGHV